MKPESECGVGRKVILVTGANPFKTRLLNPSISAHARTLNSRYSSKCRQAESRGSGEGSGGASTRCLALRAAATAVARKRLLRGQPRRVLLIRSSQTGSGRISASRLTTRPTRHPYYRECSIFAWHKKAQNRYPKIGFSTGEEKPFTVVVLYQDRAAINYNGLPSSESFLYQEQIGLRDLGSFADSANRETVANALV
jgi:hypothetical protein